MIKDLVTDGLSPPRGFLVTTWSVTKLSINKATNSNLNFLGRFGPLRLSKRLVFLFNAIISFFYVI